MSTETETKISFSSNGTILTDTTVTKTDKKYAEYTNYAQLIRSLGKQRLRNTVAEITGGGIIAIGGLMEAVSAFQLLTYGGIQLTPAEAFTDQIFKVGIISLGAVLTRKTWREGDILTKLEKQQAEIDKKIPTHMYEPPIIKSPV